MSFSELRKARDRRQASYIGSQSEPLTQPALEPLNNRTGSLDHGLPEIYSCREGLYPSLRDSYDIRVDSVMGRGVFVKPSLTGSIKAGESGTLISDLAY